MKLPHTSEYTTGTTILESQILVMIQLLTKWIFQGQICIGNDMTWETRCYMNIHKDSRSSFVYLFALAYRLFHEDFSPINGVPT